MLIQWSYHSFGVSNRVGLVIKKKSLDTCFWHTGPQVWHHIDYSITNAKISTDHNLKSPTIFGLSTGSIEEKMDGIVQKYTVLFHIFCISSCGMISNGWQQGILCFFRCVYHPFRHSLMLFLLYEIIHAALFMYSAISIDCIRMLPTCMHLFSSIIPTLAKWHLYVDTAPWLWSTSSSINS